MSLAGVLGDKCVKISVFVWIYCSKCFTFSSFGS